MPWGSKQELEPLANNACSTQMVKSSFFIPYFAIIPNFAG
jgi:hypothetical protein